MTRMKGVWYALLLSALCAWPSVAHADLKESDNFVDINVDHGKGFAMVILKDPENAKAIYDALQVAPYENAEKILIKNVQLLEGDQKLQFLCWKKENPAYGCAIKIQLTDAQNTFKVQWADEQRKVVLRSANNVPDAAAVIDKALPATEKDGRVKVDPGVDPYAGVNVNGGLAYTVPPDPKPEDNKPKPRFQLKTIKDTAPDANGKTPTFFEIIVTRPTMAPSQASVQATAAKVADMPPAAVWQ